MVKCFAKSPSAGTPKISSHQAGRVISPRFRAAFGTVTIARPSCRLSARSGPKFMRVLVASRVRLVPKKIGTGVQIVEHGSAIVGSSKRNGGLGRKGLG